MSKVEYSATEKTTFREFYAINHALRKLIEDVHNAIARGDQRSELFFASLKPYGEMYEKPFEHLIEEFIALIPRWAHELSPVVSPNPSGEVLDTIDQVLTGQRDQEIRQATGDFSDTEKEKFLALCFALESNLKCLGMFGVYLSDLVSKAKLDDKALFGAVLVDVAVLEIPWVAARTKKADLCNDQNFLNEITKSTNKSKARRHSDLDDLRLMLAVVDEKCGLENLTDDELLDLFVNDLQLLPKEGEDPLAALKWHISKRQKECKK